ncbi:MAG: transcriptional initiation protein Tat [Alphaproteobacteria bacterium]|nr:transcriptional initiation protein Tat [Alphaproteobacteria bacterium]
MSFDRRDMLMGVGAIFGAALAAPLQKALAAEAVATVVPGYIASRTIFTAAQRSDVAAISERIIPTTDTPGAIAAGVPGFIEMMLADWYEAGDRDEFLTGLTVIDGFCTGQHVKSFAALAPAEQDAVLTCAMNGMMPGLATGFFEHCRQMVILGYYTSEIGCRQERIYLPLPGRYDGHYPYPGKVFSS